MDVVADRGAFGIARGATGTFTGDGTLTNVTLGYRPKMVTLVNVTDALKLEKIDGMAANATLQTVTAGTQTVTTTSAITINDSGFAVTAAIAADGDDFVWFVA